MKCRGGPCVKAFVFEREHPRSFAKHYFPAAVLGGGAGCGLSRNRGREWNRLRWNGDWRAGFRALVERLKLGSNSSARKGRLSRLSREFALRFPRRVWRDGRKPWIHERPS